jgi:hypothetical protein
MCMCAWLWPRCAWRAQHSLVMQTDEYATAPQIFFNAAVCTFEPKIHVSVHGSDQGVHDGHNNVLMSVVCTDECCVLTNVHLRHTSRSILRYKVPVHFERTLYLHNMKQFYIICTCPDSSMKPRQPVHKLSTFWKSRILHEYLCLYAVTA